MSREATCVRCKHILRVSSDATDRWLTCPRCLASVGNPYVLHPAEPVAATAIAAASPQQAPLEVHSCPSCHRQVEPGWRVCPFCEETLRGTGPRPTRGSLDAEVRRDSRGANIAAIVLGGILAVGAVLFVSVGGPELVAPRDAAAAAWIGFTSIGMFVAGLIIIAVGARRVTVRFVVGLVGGAFAVLLLVLVMCMAVLANINANIPPPGTAPAGGSGSGLGDWAISICQCGKK